jgi:hypothetical protein
MISIQEEISLFFTDYDWCTVFDVAVRGNDGKKGLNEINNENPTHIIINDVNDIKTILGFSEPQKLGGNYVILIETFDNSYAFFSVAMVEHVEDWGDKQKSYMTYPFRSLVAKDLLELYTHLTLNDKEMLYNDSLQSLLEKLKLDNTVENTTQKTQKYKL